MHPPNTATSPRKRAAPPFFALFNLPTLPAGRCALHHISNPPHFVLIEHITCLLVAIAQSPLAALYGWPATNRAVLQEVDQARLWASNTRSAQSNKFAVSLWWGPYPPTTSPSTAPCNQHPSPPTSWRPLTPALEPHAALRIVQRPLPPRGAPRPPAPAHLLHPPAGGLGGRLASVGDQ